jgi:nitroreductase
VLERMNFAFFGAPVGLFFCIERRMGPPQWADLGMFMQSFMLLAVEAGLATCPQEIWSTWPRTVAAEIGLPPEPMIFAGMSLGYADNTSPMNSYRTVRAPLDSFATLHGFD